jgi:biotin synthase
MRSYICDIGDKVLGGEGISFSEAAKLLEVDNVDLVHLMAASNQVRHHFRGDQVDLCTLLNAKSGRCSEDCKFCAQSAHYQGTCDTYPLLHVEEIVRRARLVESKGGRRFCIITSGKSPAPGEFESVLEAVRRIRRETRLSMDCSLGILSAEQAAALKEAGVDRYNHNLETAPGCFEKVCTTHAFSDRLETLHRLKDNGFSICSGGIIGLGETLIQWLEMVFILREVEVDCIPVNILNPRMGTPLESMIAPAPLEILKLLAIMRLIVPKADIKLAGGRELALKDFQATALLAGVSGIIVGGYLTTRGRSENEDYEMLRNLGRHWGPPTITSSTNPISEKCASHG